jgi:hypothetical protein
VVGPVAEKHGKSHVTNQTAPWFGPRVSPRAEALDRLWFSVCARTLDRSGVWVSEDTHSPKALQKLAEFGLAYG